MPAGIWEPSSSTRCQRDPQLGAIADAGAYTGRTTGQAQRIVRHGNTKVRPHDAEGVRVRGDERRNRFLAQQDTNVRQDEVGPSPDEEDEDR
jgi:hypothetical protein